MKERASIDERMSSHAAFHGVERDRYDDAVQMATSHPQWLTCITIDAPTRHQFDLPCQATGKRDTVKKLDGTSRWQSKLEGVLDAGYGMHMFIARSALGGGPNLVATALVLALFNRVEHSDRPLGSSLRVQLDNTCGENKCTTIIGVCAWLVHAGHFQQVSCPPQSVPRLATATYSPAATAPIKHTQLTQRTPTPHQHDLTPLSPVWPDRVR